MSQLEFGREIQKLERYEVGKVVDEAIAASANADGNASKLGNALTTMEPTLA